MLALIRGKRKRSALFFATASQIVAPNVSTGVQSEIGFYFDESQCGEPSRATAKNMRE
jgi:hypothetical protein